MGGRQERELPADLPVPRGYSRWALRVQVLRLLRAELLGYVRPLRPASSLSARRVAHQKPCPCYRPVLGVSLHVGWAATSASQLAERQTSRSSRTVPVLQARVGRLLACRLG